MYRHRRRHFIRQLVYRPTVKQQYNSRIRQTDKTGKNPTKLAALSRRALTALVASLLSFSVTRIITACDSNPSFLAFLWFSTGRDLYRSRTRRTVFRRRFWRSRLLGTPGRRSLLRWRTGLGRRCRFRRLRWRRGLWSWLGRCWGLLFWFQFRFLCVSLRYAQETRLSLNGVLMKLVNENLTKITNWSKDADCTCEPMCCIDTQTMAFDRLGLLDRSAELRLESKSNAVACTSEFRLMVSSAQQTDCGHIAAAVKRRPSQ